MSPLVTWPYQGTHVPRSESVKHIEPTPRLLSLRSASRNLATIPTHNRSTVVARGNRKKIFPGFPSVTAAAKRPAQEDTVVSHDSRGFRDLRLEA